MSFEKHKSLSPGSTVQVPLNMKKEGCWATVLNEQLVLVTPVWWMEVYLLQSKETHANYEWLQQYRIRNSLATNFNNKILYCWCSIHSWYQILCHCRSVIIMICILTSNLCLLLFKAMSFKAIQSINQSLSSHHS